MCVPSLDESSYSDLDSSLSDINDNSLCEESECEEANDLPKFPSHTFQKKVHIKKTGKKKGQKRSLLLLYNPHTAGEGKQMSEMVL